jgi:transposase
MPKGYSKDLRKRAIEYKKEGVHTRDVAIYLKVCERSVDRWWVEWLEEERLSSKEGYQKGYDRKIPDEEEFEAFILANPNKSQAELGRMWRIPCSATTIGKGMKRIGYSYKKKTIATKSKTAKRCGSLSKN